MAVEVPTEWLPTHLEQNPRTRMRDNSSLQAELVVIYLHGVAEPPMLTSFPQRIGRRSDVRVITISPPGFDGAHPIALEPRTMAEHHLAGLFEMIKEGRHQRALLVAHSYGNRPAYSIKALWNEVMDIPLVCSVESATPQLDMARSLARRGAVNDGLTDQERVGVKSLLSGLASMPPAAQIQELARLSIAHPVRAGRMISAVSRFVGTGFVSGSITQLAPATDRVLSYVSAYGRQFWAVAEYAGGHDSTPEIRAGSHVPTVLVRGARDLISKAGSTRYVADLCHPMASITIPHWGHNNFANVPDVANANVITDRLIDACLRMAPTPDALAAIAQGAAQAIEGSTRLNEAASRQHTGVPSLPALPAVVGVN